MENKLKLHKKNASKHLAKLANKLFTHNKIQYIMNNELNIFEASTYYDKNGYAVKTEIGIQEINYSKSFLQRINHTVSDKDFI